MKVVIRSYKDEDWKGVCRVHDRSRPYEVENFMPQELVMTMERAVVEEDNFFESKKFVATDEQGKIIGFICIQGDELTWLYVDPDYHGQGVGTALVEHVRSGLGKDGFVLCTQENEKGFCFYQKVGFQPVAFFPGSVQGYPCTCVRMTLPGSVHANRPPQPVKESLLAHGYSEDNWGKAERDQRGIWRWVRE